MKTKTKNNFDNNDANQKFISRKTKRKMMREEKKNKKNFFYKNRNDQTALINYKEKEKSLKQKLFPQKLKKTDSKSENENNKNNKSKSQNKQKQESKENNSNDLDLNESSMDERINNYSQKKKEAGEFDSYFDDEINSDIASFTSNEDQSLNENSDENINSEQEDDSELSEKAADNKSKQNNENKKGIASRMESLNKAMKKTLNEIDIEEESQEKEDSEDLENEFEQSDNEENEEENGDWESVSDESGELAQEKNQEKEFENKKNKIEAYEGFDDEDEPSDVENDEGNVKNNNQNNNGNYMDVMHPAYNDLDDEIKKLERKLGITKKDKYERLKKKVASENFDEDLFDFLDEIDHYVQDKKEGKASNSKAKPNQIKTAEEAINDNKNKKTLANKKEKKANKENSESEISEKKESLADIKAKSKLFSKTKISEEQLLKNQLNKDIIAILNRISEGNLSMLVKDFLAKLDGFEIEFTKISNRKQAVISIYEITTRNCLKAIAEQIVTNITISSCIATYVSILHFKYGNSFMLYFIKTLIESFNNNFDLLMKDANSANKAELKNLIFLLIQFYLYGNLTARLYYDLIKKFIDTFSDVSSELLLLLLNYLGIELRKEDPESLKEIFRRVHSKYNSSVAQNKIINDNNNVNNDIQTGDKVINLQQPQTNSSKIKFVVEMIEEIKNNKFMKFNMNEKFNFFKNFVNNTKKDYTQENYNLNSEKIADKIDIGLESLKNFDKNKLQDYIEEGNESNLRLNDFVLENIDDIEIDDNIFCNNKVLEQKMQKLKLTTDLKKKIFKAIVGATEFIDAYERLNRLNLKKDQAREMIKILILLVGSEKKYNLFYKILLERLMEFEKDHRYTFHYTIWDNMRIMNTFKEHKIDNIAKLTSDLLVGEKIALPVFLHFDFEEADKSNKAFVVKTFNYLFSNKKSEPEKIKILFAKLVKNDDHVEFAKRLFAFLKNDFRNSKIVDFDNKQQEFIDKLNSALKVLSRVL